MVIDKLIRSKRRSISIQISSTGELVVRVPHNCSMERINKVLEEKQAWITHHQQRILQNKLLNSDVISYRKVLFLGYTKDVIFADKIKQLMVSSDCLFLPQKIKEDVSKQKKVISKFLITQAHEILEKRVSYFATIMQLEPEGFMLTNSKKLWGSCSQKNIIKLNWRLVMAHPDTIDYVVVHELSHMLEFNHSKNFWKIVETLVPDYKQKREVLKKGDFLLTLFR